MQKTVDWFSAKKKTIRQSWLQFTKLGQFLSTPIYRSKSFSLHGRIQRTFANLFVVSPSIVFTRKAVVDETSNQKSTKIFNPITVIGASQLSPYSMSQPMPNGICWRRNFDSENSELPSLPKKTRNGEKICANFNG